MGKWSKVLIVTAFVIVLAAGAAAAVNVKNPRDVSFAGIPEGDAPETMPEIVFVYHCCAARKNDDSILHYTAIVDEQGNIYYSYNREIAEYFFDERNIEQLYDKYEAGELLPMMIKRGSVDMEALQSKYSLLGQIGNNPEFTLHYKKNANWLYEPYDDCKNESCHGICYGRDSDRKDILLFDRTRYEESTSTDKRVNEIMEWMWSVIDYEEKVEKML